MARNVPTDALEAPDIRRAGLNIVHRLLLATYSDRARIAIPDRSCAYPTETYGAILRICLTSISTEFQSLSTSPLNFYCVLRADGHAVPALVVDIDIDHPEASRIYTGHQRCARRFYRAGLPGVITQRLGVRHGGHRAARPGEAASTVVVVISGESLPARRPVPAWKPKQ